MSHLQLSTPPSQLVGRERERARLQQVIDSVMEGQKRAVMLVGAPGIGKTTLLRWTYDKCEKAGIISTLVRTPAGAGLPPRFPLPQLLEGVRGACIDAGIAIPAALDRAIAVLQGKSQHRSNGLLELAAAIEGIALSRVVGIFIDDCHWADRESLEQLLSALRFVDSPILLAFTIREPQAQPGSIDPESSSDLWIDRLELRELGAAQTAAFVASQLGGPVTPSTADLLRQQTFGNPLLLREYLRELADAGSLASVAGYWAVTCDSLPPPGSLHAIVGRRIRRLGMESRGALRLLSLFGREAEFGELRDALALETTEAVELLVRLVRDELVLEEPETNKYRLAHPLFGAAALESATATEVAELHQRIYHTILRGGRASPTELARHAQQSLEPPALTPMLIRRAAEQAESTGSFREAERWYSTLARLAPDGEAALEALSRQAQMALHFEPQRAANLFSEALGLHANQAQRADLLLGRAYAFRLVGLFDEALSDLRAAEAVIEQTDPRIEHALAVLYGIRGDIPEAELRLKKLARETDDRSLRGQAVGHLAQVAVSRGNLSSARTKLEEALTLVPSGRIAAGFRVNLSWILAIGGQWEEAEIVARSNLESTAASGDTWNLHGTLTNLARLEIWRGNHAHALDCVMRSEKLLAALDNPMCELDTQNAYAVFLLETGRPAEARSVAERISALIEQVKEPVEQSSHLATAAEAYVRAGEYEQAARALDAAMAWLYFAPHWEVSVLRATASLALAKGDADSAVQAVDSYRPPSDALPFEEASLWEIGARAHHAIGERDMALTLADRSLGVYTSLGSGLRAARMVKWLETHPVRRRGRPPRRNQDGLTQREAEILKLLSTGHSNAEIATMLTLSRLTVKKHVENILRKTGKRRAQLILAAAGGYADIDTTTDGI